MRFLKLLARVACVLACLGHTEPTVAQGPAPAAPQATAAAPTTAIAPGRLVVVVFLAGAEPVGVEVLTDTGVSATTNASGAARLEVAPGERTLTFRIPKAVAPGAASDFVEASVSGVSIQSGEATQVLVNFDAAGQLVSTDIEAPETAQPDVVEVASQDESVGFGMLGGVVLSDEAKTPIAGARVFVRGVEGEEMTDANGRFSFKLPVGVQAVSVIHSKFSTRTVEDVEILKDDEVELEILLLPASIQLEDFIVTAPYVEGGVAALVAERRESTAVADVIGAEQIAQSGDSDAAGALKRVTGLTVVGGKFVYVRGMGERYSSTLMNGLNIPSPEPERRVVPLDLIPADILDSVVIQKTFSPEMPGEFGGGSVQLRTKRFPKEFSLDISGSVGLNTRSTFGEGLRHRGGTTDWLGIDDGGRELPANVAAQTDFATANTVNPDGLTDEELEALGDSFSSNLKVFRKTVPVDHGLGVTVGDTLDIGVPFGYTVALGYDRKYRLVEDREVSKISINKENQTLVRGAVATTEEGKEAVNATAFALFGLEPAPNHELSSMTVLLRTSENLTKRVSGTSSDRQDGFVSHELRWVERQLFTTQLAGHHAFTTSDESEVVADSPQFDWRYGFSLAERSQPDRRRYRYDGTRSGIFVFSNDSSNIERFFSDLSDPMHEAALDFKLPLPLSDSARLVPVVGASVQVRGREVGARRFQLNNEGDRGGVGFRAQAPSVALSPDHIHEDGHTITDVTLTEPPFGEDGDLGKGADNYEARQSIAAAYAKIEATLFEDLDLMAGARVEKFIQETTSFDLFDREREGGEAKSRLDNFEVLPAATLTWRFLEDFQLRAGFGITVSRPDFRETSASRFFRVEDAVTLRGNPELTRTLIRNYDLRLEWYLSSDESFSIAGFFKDFEKPIEIISQASAGTEWTWLNTPSATNVGVEIEGRKRLDFFGDAFQNYYVSGNVALIRSEVDLRDLGPGLLLTSTERPLQGQSPYVVNVRLGYDGVDDDDVGLNAALLYNVFGERIDTVGANEPDSIEQPYHQLDAVASYSFGPHWSVKLKAKNLVDARHRKLSATESDEAIREAFRRGRGVSLSAKWSY